MSESNEEEKAKCVLCEALLESKEALKLHFRQHANNEIDLKGRRLTRTGELADAVVRGQGYFKGMGSMVNGTKVTCDICGETFGCNTKAIQHRFKQHPSEIAKHYCPYCGMQFPLKDHRDNHVDLQHKDQTSSAPSNFPCYICGAVFYNAKAHEYHDNSAHHRVVTLHKQIPTPPPSKKIRCTINGDKQSVYYCHLCGFEYIVKFNLQKHLERQHTLEERSRIPDELYKCRTCDGMFATIRAYQNHEMYHKPDDVYVTSEEQRLKVITRVDQDFDGRRVMTAAERYIPKFRHKPRRQKIELPVKRKESSDDEMSPASSMGSSDEDDEIVRQRTTLFSDSVNKSVQIKTNEQASTSIENDDEIRNNVDISDSEENIIPVDVILKESPEINVVTEKSIDNCDNVKATS